MSKPLKNPNIGTVVCGWRGCELLAAVRRNAGGKLYTDCIEHGAQVGMLAPNQDALLAEADIWGQDGAPPGTPRWIAEQWPTARARALKTDALVLTRAPEPRDLPARSVVPGESGAGSPEDIPEHLPEPPPQKSEAPAGETEPAAPGDSDPFWD